MIFYENSDLFIYFVINKTISLNVIFVVNKGFIHVVNDHIHEPNNLLNRNE